MDQTRDQNGRSKRVPACVLSNKISFPVNRSQKFVNILLDFDIKSILFVSFSMVNFSEMLLLRSDFIANFVKIAGQK